MDVFRFDSPSQPLLRDPDLALKWSSKPSTKRRKVCSAMDGSSYYAHVVRVSEPSLVASQLSSAPAHYLETLLDAGFLPSTLSCPPGVSEEDIADTTKAREDISASHPVSAGTSDSSHIAIDTARITSTHHPRPLSSDLQEEEDSRRIRFALSDGHDDHVERLRRSHMDTNPRLATDTSYSSELSISLHEHQQASIQTLSRNVNPPEVFFQPRPWELPFDASAIAAFLPPPPPFPLFTPSQVLWDDEPLLAVDDHRRSYDFADFMDQWGSRYRQEDDVPDFVPPPGPPPWRRKPEQYVQDITEDFDMQGLRWESLGTDRALALRARELLHPERVSDRADYDPNFVQAHDLYYRFRSFAPRHRIRYSHYQLRNMITAGRGRNVYHAVDSQVTKASLSCPSAGHTVMDLTKPSHSASPFKVTCLATANSIHGQDELLLAGGFNGEYAMLNLDASVSSGPVEGTVSHAKDGIINHISAFQDRQGGSPRAAFSSNDHGIRIMDLPRQRIIDTFTYDSAINCSAMSPDGRLRAFAPDSAIVMVTNAETGEVLCNLDAHTDFAFACDWSPCGRYLATGAEDSQVVIWDSRNWSRPLHKLPSIMSCARSLHFTCQSVLVVAESEDVVSVVDTVDFDRRQDFRFFGAIAGVALLNGGSEMIVANADETVGGLLSFESVARGRGDGGFGRQVNCQSSWRRRRCEGAVVDVMI